MSHEVMNQCKSVSYSKIRRSIRQVEKKSYFLFSSVEGYVHNAKDQKIELVKVWNAIKED